MPDKEKLHIALIDDESAIRRILGRELEGLGLTVSTFEDAASARSWLQEQTPDAIVLDVRLPGISGDQFLRELADLAPSVPVIMLTGHANVDLAVECMKLGAVDLLTKPCSIDHLELAIRRAVEGTRLREKTRTLTRHTQPLRPLPKLSGSSEPMACLRRMIGKVAGFDESVLIIGESGTGKELIARMIQQQSNRAKAAYLTVNCAAVSETLLESELFGHEKGAFTGAEERRLGFFEIADGGTLFLDEIGDMPISMQPKLLRVLQSGEFRRVGGNKALHADVRVIAATNKSLIDEVREGRFREDLMHRVNTITLDAPPLRERIEDLNELIELFSKELGEEYVGRPFGKETLDILRNYAWPGNVRELRNVVRRALILSESDEIQPEDLPRHLRQMVKPADENTEAYVFDSNMTIADLEKRHILAMLDDCGGNKTQAARKLGVSVKTLYNKLEAWQSDDEAE
ncbi:sigma-54 dependent transcriptional regulator [bacterium]|nr:sigma-54 dependent transcriptional regulator [bacterium]